MREGDAAVMIGSPKPCLENISQVQTNQDKPQALFNMFPSFITLFSTKIFNFSKLLQNEVPKLQAGNENHHWELTLAIHMLCNLLTALCGCRHWGVILQSAGVWFLFYTASFFLSISGTFLWFSSTGLSSEIFSFCKQREVEMLGPWFSTYE